jgi:S-formylglutathione hydrolase FrmB
MAQITSRFKVDTRGRLQTCALSPALVVAGVLALCAMFGSGAAQASQLVTVTIPDQRGEIPSKWLSYPGPPKANVLLPDNYDASTAYPLLVMLNGLNTNYAWYAQWLLPQLQGLNAIVVMPEGGSGWYTDWWNNGERGSPAWESYELNEVLPYIRDHYKILPQRQYHAIAGTSMGGLGATYLGGRLPGFFGSVASLSGFDDPQYYAQITDPAMGLTAEAPVQGDYDLDPVEGPPRGFYMHGHNPSALAMNLEQTRVFESTGNGIPSSADLADPTGAGDQAYNYALERMVIYSMSQRYHKALVTAGVDVTYQVHRGGHLIPDFAAEIEAMRAWGLFKPVVTNPTSWVNDTVATSGQLWDIGYHFDQPPNAVVQFRRSGSSLSVSAAGSAVTITTAGGCVIHTGTPATIPVPSHSC